MSATWNVDVGRPRCTPGRVGSRAPMADQAQRRARAWITTQNHRAAREAQSELRRMGRDPGPLLGAVERLRRAHDESEAEGDKPA